MTSASATIYLDSDRLLQGALEKQHLALKCGVVVLKREKADISHLVACVSSRGHRWDSLSHFCNLSISQLKLSPLDSSP